MRKLYLTYQKSQTLSDQLTQSHYVELLKIEDPMERSFYEKEAANENQGVISFHSRNCHKEYLMDIFGEN